jgi:hypothetical protein
MLLHGSSADRVTRPQTSDSDRTRGFKLGVTMAPGSWNARCLKRDDRNLVDLIGQIAAGKDLRFDPRAIIGSWIIARFSKRR